MDDLSVRKVDDTDLVIMDGTRIIVLKKIVVQKLHNINSGLTKILLTAHKPYYWPSMHSDIKTFIDACVLCQEAHPSLPRQKLLSPTVPSNALQPIHSVSVEFYYLQQAMNMWQLLIAIVAMHGLNVSPLLHLDMCYLCWKAGLKSSAGNYYSNFQTTDLSFVLNFLSSALHLTLTIRRAMSWPKWPWRIWKAWFYVVKLEEETCVMLLLAGVIWSAKTACHLPKCSLSDISN